jgi:alpha-beta hydrolase superfamily lysophospholipase
MKSTLQTTDGLTLSLRAWPREGARGSVVIVHGLGEHIGRHARVAAHLNDWGWSVFGHDHRGHGASEGPRGRLASADDLIADLALVIDHARRSQPGPLVLLGHSLGGLVAARFVAEGVPAGASAPGPAPSAAPARWHRPVDALVLSSPVLDPALRPAQKLLLAVLGPLAPNLAVNNGLQPEWISRDPAVVAAYRADPLVHDRIAPRLVRFIVDAGAEVIADAPRWPVPTLLLYAGADRCVAPAGSAAFAAAAPKELVTARVFETLFHEIFNEPEQDAVFEVLRGWLASRTADAPTAGAVSSKS